jgi:hypothetical protein
MPQLACDSLATLTALLAALPASLRNHAPTLEPAVGAALVALAANCGASTKFAPAAADCLAALPRMQADGSAYSAQFRLLLLSLHDVLDSLFMGLDDGAAAAAARTQLAPAPRATGTAPESLLQLQLLGVDAGGGGVGGSAAQRAGTKRRVNDTQASQLAAVAEAVLATAERMLVGPYNAPVCIPWCDVLCGCMDNGQKGSSK